MADAHPLAGTVYTGAVIRTPKKMLTGSGAPSFCWHCGNQLQRAPGKGAGLFFFNLVAGPDGQQHRIHGDCTKSAILNGCRLVSPESNERPVNGGRSASLRGESSACSPDRDAAPDINTDGVTACVWPHCECPGLLDKPKPGECQHKVGAFGVTVVPWVRPQECSATGAGHHDGPYGPKGQRQCHYCGQPPSDGVKGRPDRLLHDPYGVSIPDSEGAPK